MRATKPTKPYKDFPLTAHPCGTWCKKIRGKLYHFGGWADPDAALRKYRHQVDAIQAGRVPDPMPGEGETKINLNDLCHDFLDTKEKRVDIGKLSKRMLFDYVSCCSRVCEILGKSRIVESLTPKDFDQLFFKLAKDKDGGNVSSVTLANRVRMSRVVFNFAFEQGHVPAPLKFGQNFKIPGRDELRKARTDAGKKLFEANELRDVLALLDGKEVTLSRVDEKTGKPVVAKGRRNPVFRAMTLLGINAGFGQSDCATLPLSAINLEKGWIEFPRPKTHVERRCPLWPETILALRESIAKRPLPKDEQFAGLAFLTTHGQPYVRVGVKGAALDAISGEFDKVRKKLEIGGRRTAFYSLRRTFETVAGNTRDQIAVDLVMGHAAASNDMGHVYRQEVDDDRLRAVANHVRIWVWPKGTNETTDRSDKKKPVKKTAKTH